MVSFATLAKAGGLSGCCSASKACLIGYFAWVGVQAS